MENEKINKIVEAIASLTVSEAVELGNQLADKYGISMESLNASSGSSSSGGEQKEAAADKTFKIIIKEIPADKKMNVLKAIKEALSLDIAGAKSIIDLVEKNGESELKKGLKETEAKELSEKVKAAGAVIEQVAE